MVQDFPAWRKHSGKKITQAYATCGCGISQAASWSLAIQQNIILGQYIISAELFPKFTWLNHKFEIICMCTYSRVLQALIPSFYPLTKWVLKHVCISKVRVGHFPCQICKNVSVGVCVVGYLSTTVHVITSILIGRFLSFFSDSDLLGNN